MNLTTMVLKSHKILIKQLYFYHPVITNFLPLVVITVILIIFCTLFSSMVLAVPVAGPDKCTPDSSSEGSPGGYSKYSCCRTVTDGNDTYTECRTCETKDGKFECGDYKKQNAAITGNDAGILQEPSAEEDRPAFGNNAGVLIKSDNEEETAGTQSDTIKNHPLDKDSQTMNTLSNFAKNKDTDDGPNQVVDRGNSHSSDLTPSNLNTDLPAATEQALNNDIKCSNPSSEIPCYGTNNADNIEGTVGEDLIYGLDGDDIITGLGFVEEAHRGYDLIDGGEGRDVLYGGANRDLISGGPGNDRIYGGPGIDYLWGLEGDDIIDGGSGNDVIWGMDGRDVIYGGKGNDKIYHGRETNSPFYDPGPDGSKDKIDCGPGIDEVWINQTPDGDIAINCEKIHSSRPDVGSFDPNIKDIKPELK